MGRIRWQMCSKICLKCGAVPFKITFWSIKMINAQLGAGFRIFIGVAELLAVAGLTLPGVTRILPVLTALAAAGLMIVMGSATVFHLFRGESESAITTAV